MLFNSEPVPVEHGAHNPDPIGHISDSSHFHIFDNFGIDIGELKLGLFEHPKFMLVMTLAAVILIALFVPVARKIQTGAVPRGRMWNFLETILLFVRDQVAIPAIGEHDYKRFLPFLWTIFLFILMMNLLGMFPFIPSVTGNIAVCAALALISFLVIHFSGMRANHGPYGYLMTFRPHVDIEGGPAMKLFGWFLGWGLFGLEIFGALVRGSVLAIRLFANMMAGHLVLFMILFFIQLIGAASHESDVANFLFWPVTGISVFLSVALSLLELFVACLQAYLFTFLTATFIGLAMHPQH